MKPHYMSPDGIHLVLGNILDPPDYYQLSTQAKAHNKVERVWKRKFKDALDEAASRALDSLAMGDLLDPDDFDFDTLVVENAIDAMRAGLRRPRVMPHHSLAAPKPPLRRIFETWDQWRKKPTARQRKDAKHIKDTFLHTVRQFWVKHSRDFRQGDAYDMGAARQAFRERAAIPQARADMVVQTETTRYYNQAITTLYSGVDGVTHYLFAAILDKRTTKWCCDFTKGGRHGLVYGKGNDITDRNTPPCHWNCRSQFLPLSLSNPKHAILIKDKARQAANRSPAPLPRGWNA